MIIVLFVLQLQLSNKFGMLNNDDDLDNDEEEIQSPTIDD